MEIEKLTFDGEGMSRVYDNKDWIVGIKNWKPANDITGIDCLERHNESDELFVLLSGRCILAYANEVGGKLQFGAVNMEPMKVYNIPKTLWHNTITEKDTKLILVEYSSTSMENSDILQLDDNQIDEVTSHAKAFL